MWGFTDKVLAGYNLGVIYGIGHRHRGHHTQESYHKVVTLLICVLYV